MPNLDCGVPVLVVLPHPPALGELGALLVVRAGPEPVQRPGVTGPLRDGLVEDRDTRGRELLDERRFGLPQALGLGAVVAQALGEHVEVVGALDGGEDQLLGCLETQAVWLSFRDGRSEGAWARVE
ncbi:hypothetical protein ALI22I_14630 [Saccharothrix sp. ALI-22-I]|nr:hypothetical protein ALI22I_14630 [Saccharothrix sp. ALI-22-I]